MVAQESRDCGMSRVLRLTSSEAAAGKAMFWARARPHKALDDVEITSFAGDDERCVTVFIWLVNGGMGGEQQLYTVAVASEAGGEQRRAAMCIWLVDGGVGGEQQLHTFPMALEAGRV